MRGDDQIMGATRSAGSAYVGQQTPMVSCGRLRIFEDIDCGRNGGQRSSPFSCPLGGLRHLDPNAVLGYRYGSDRKLILIES